ncbi:hypothetical protein MLD38_022736 [Melastoma candidum]|uniref:Uncharacterized protein n=1 Tax=Melastoma candidum TaxID=119954 RepID=A0ACB9QNB2_9MYRT|nr:hypothetical protein MLD38_022736 [Melastoma candidum]
MPYRSDAWTTAATCPFPPDLLQRIERMAREGPVVIFSSSTCCMCHAAKSLFSGMGASPTVHELDRDPAGRDIEKALLGIVGGALGRPLSTTGTVLPVVFIGGMLVGSMDRVMASHINGTLVPLLKEAGALWL